MEDMWSFDVSSLVAGFIFGVIGLWMFREARRKHNNNTKYIGIALMIYPYFIDGAVRNWGLGITLCILAYFLW
jgi:multisubunit Na+/H+ antiporter MnhE subunit